MHHAPLIVCTTRVLPRRVHYAPLIACVSYLELRALSASDATHCVHYAPLIVCTMEPSLSSRHGGQMPWPAGASWVEGQHDGSLTRIARGVLDGV